jgi:hypothetical protein
MSKVEHFFQNLQPKFWRHFSYRPCVYISLPPQPPWFYCPYIWWRIKKLLIMKLSKSSCYFHLGPNIFFSTLFWKVHNVVSSLMMRGQVSHPHKTGIKLQQAYWFLVLSFLSHLWHTFPIRVSCNVTKFSKLYIINSIGCVLPPSSGRPDDGSSTHLWKVCLLQRDYTALYPTRL